MSMRFVGYTLVLGFAIIQTGCCKQLTRGPCTTPGVLSPTPYCPPGTAMGVQAPGAPTPIYNSPPPGATIGSPPPLVNPMP